MTATVEITLDAEATGRVIPAVAGQIQGDPDICYPAEPARIEDLCITIRVPARCIGGVDAQGFVRVDVTALVSGMDADEAIDSLIEAYEDQS